MAVEIEAAPGPGAGGTLLGVGLVVVGVWRFTCRVKEVRLYEDGLTWAQGGEEWRYRWEDVECFYRSDVFLYGSGPLSEANRVTVTLELRDDTAVTFSDWQVEKCPLLADMVQTRVTRALLPGAREELEESEADFGPIRLRRDGLTVEGTFFAWQRVRRLWLEFGKLLCEVRPGKPVSVPLADVPNYLVLFSLLSELGHPLETAVGRGGPSSE
jgi:hypothetical protein